MNKGTRLIKRLVALILVLLLCIESFGAVVSDNDGSAFITKAEFDSLKNSFQSQIDQYNSSIDSKIDGAIAGYLAGIKVNKKSKINLNGELSDVGIGKGYRSFNVTDLSNRVTDLGEWIISTLTMVPRMGTWLDISNGIVSMPRKSKDDTLDDSSLVDIIGYDTNKWYIYSQTTPGWGSDNNQKYIMPATIVTNHSGTLDAGLGYKRPIIWTESDGTITSFDNERISIIDSRFYKGGNYPSSFKRGVVLHGSKWNDYEDFVEMKFNENNELVGYGGPFDSTTGNDKYLNHSDGYVRGLVRAATSTYNATIICNNLTDTSLVDAFDDEKSHFYINNKVKNTDFQLQDSTVFKSQAVLTNGFFVQGSTGGYDTDHKFYLSRPEVHFRPLVANTTLNTTNCFSTDSNDYYKRLKMKYLKNGSFYGSNGEDHPYIYEGLPIYKAEKDGKLEFKIKISTNYNASALPWVDPGSSTSRIKLRVKSSEFTIGDTYTNVMQMKVGTSTAPITDTTPKVTEASIKPGELTTIEIDDCEVKKTYFLRWYVDGYTYGGEITYLGDAYFTEEG